MDPTFGEAPREFSYAEFRAYVDSYSRIREKTIQSLGEREEGNLASSPGMPWQFGQDLKGDEKAERLIRQEFENQDDFDHFMTRYLALQLTVFYQDGALDRWLRYGEEYWDVTIGEALIDVAAWHPVDTTAMLFPLADFADAVARSRFAGEEL
ncbi:hypothetical protein [Thiohalorhabdus methylotrophus]|uniref:Uncharacterized protein n=1 Tax=Thiohalorhabdus methylotrophus TaxID=3242694 RepID=A0ABV4TXG2_9GAMM